MPGLGPKLDPLKLTQTHPKWCPQTIQASPNRLDAFRWLPVHFEWV